MRLHTVSHQYAENILETAFRDEWEQLLEVFGRVDPPLRPAEPFTTTGRPMTPKRQVRPLGGRRAHALLPIDQVALNDVVDAEFKALGWNRQPYVLGETLGTPLDSYLKGDFERSGVYVEVEFGNTASLFRDLFKFQVAGRSGIGKVGVLVVATAAVTRLFDSGVATYEQAVNLLPYMKIGLQLPTVVVGLDIVDWAPIEQRYAEMYEVATANGITCHPFEVVRRTDDPTPPIPADPLTAKD
ncbi:MAG: hypothetical protein M3395_00945 [Chloroflexota bacterium]|nr:hypothetical protein [Chloroflexota bacterium]MDQ3690056.1 hypothetical protein [Chloroflexota bacterium]